MKEIISPQTRTDVWEGKCYIDFLSRYYGSLSDKYANYHMYLRFFLLAPVGSIYVYIKDYPWAGEISVISGVLIGVFAVWDHLSAYQKKHTVANMIARECQTLEVEFNDLWNSANSNLIGNDEAKRQLKVLNRKRTATTTVARLSGITHDDYALRDKMEEESNVFVEGRRKPMKGELA